MRTVDTRWQNLAAGLRRAEQLDRELGNDWVPRIQEARRRRLDAERAAWRGRQDADRGRFEEQHSAWRVRYSERCREDEERLRVWTEALSDEWQRLRDRARSGTLSGLAAIAVLAAVLVLLAAPVWSYVLAAATVLSLTLGPAALSCWALARLRGEKPSHGHADDPEPRPPATEPDPRPDPRDPLAVKIVEQWWDEISSDPGNPRSERTHGDEGVEDFWNHLAARLPNSYVAVRELLVRRKLDVDVLVVGPSGISVFEVKHWSGEITCLRGRWRRRRTWFEPGGYETSEEKDIESFDQQWLREEHAVKETLRRRLPQLDPLVLTIDGGLVFSHPSATWTIDESCRSGYGKPEFWAKTIIDGEALPKLTPEDQLRVLDALLKWAHRLDEVGRAASNSVELAQRLFSNAIGSARAYLES